MFKDKIEFVAKVRNKGHRTTRQRQYTVNIPIGIVRMHKIKPDSYYHVILKKAKR